MNGDGSMETCTLSYVRQRGSENLPYDSGSSVMLCDDLEEWDGMGGGREAMAHSC